MTIDWSAMYEPEWVQERKALIRAHQEQQRAQHATPAAQSHSPPEPTTAQKTQAVASAGARSDGTARTNTATRHEPERPRVPDPVDALSAAMDTARDDAERRALLAAAPRSVREQFNARLGYEKFLRSVEPDPYPEFERALDAARDDAARRALIAGRDAAFLAEWAWRMRATVDDWQRRYLEMVDEPA